MSAKASAATKTLRVPFLDLLGLYQQHRDEFDRAIADVLGRAAYVKGPALAAFEKSFGEWLGAGVGTVGCANGTDAITLAARALNLPAGSEAIVPAMTFFGTVEGLLHAGFKVRLADVAADTGLVTAESLRQALTPQTKLIVPVHLYGQMAAMDEISALAREAGCLVLEDAAQAHGARWKGKSPGAWGDIACFSFYPGKNLGAFGDAGAVVARDAEKLDRVRALANHGGVQKYHHEHVGYNSRLDTLQAAVLGVKLKYIDGWNARRRAVAAKYLRGLSGLAKLTLPVEREGATHVYHLFVVQTDRRDALAKFLADRGIDTGLHYPDPIHRLPALRNTLSDSRLFPNAERFARQGLSLPMCPLLTEAQTDWVVESVQEFFR